MILIECFLFIIGNERAVLQQAQREKRLEKAHFVLIDAHRIKGADVQGANFDVFDSGTLQRFS